MEEIRAMRVWLLLDSLVELEGYRIAGYLFPDIAWVQD